MYDIQLMSDRTFIILTGWKIWTSAITFQLLSIFTSFFTINILHAIVLCMVYFFQLLLKQNYLIRNSPTQCNMFFKSFKYFFTVRECNTIYFLLFSIRFFFTQSEIPSVGIKYKYYLENYELWQKISTLYMYMHVNIACLFILDIFSFVFIMTFMTSTISLIFTCICIKDSGICVCIYKFNRLMRYLYKCITCFLNILSLWFNVPDTCVYLYTWTCVFMMYIIGRVSGVVFLQHFISKKSNPSISFYLERLICF